MRKNLRKLRFMLLPVLFLHAACTSSKNQQKDVATSTNQQRNSIKNYGFVFFDLGDLEDSYSNHTIGFAVGGTTSEPIESELLIPPKAKREATEKKHPYVYIANARQTCNDHIPLYVQMQIKNPAGTIVANLNRSLTQEDCDFLSICVRLVGKPETAQMQIKKAKTYVESNSPLPQPVETGGTGEKSEGTQDKPAVDKQESPVDSSTPTPSPAEKSVAESFHVDCRS